MKAMLISTAILFLAATQVKAEAESRDYSLQKVECTTEARKVDLQIQHHLVAGIIEIKVNTAKDGEKESYKPITFHINAQNENTRLILGASLSPLYPKTPIVALIFKSADYIYQTTLAAKIANTTTEALALQTTVLEEAKCTRKRITK